MMKNVTDDLKQLFEQFKFRAEDSFISIIVSDKWASSRGILKIQLENGFHFIISKIMLKEIKKLSTSKNYQSVFPLYYTEVPIIESDDMAKKILAEGWKKANPFIFWNDNLNPFSNCDS